MMSESEEESAFASADEGEKEDQQQVKAKPKSPENVKGGVKVSSKSSSPSMDAEAKVDKRKPQSGQKGKKSVKAAGQGTPPKTESSTKTKTPADKKQNASPQSPAKQADSGPNLKAKETHKSKMSSLPSKGGPPLPKDSSPVLDTTQVTQEDDGSETPVTSIAGVTSHDASLDGELSPDKQCVDNNGETTLQAGDVRRGLKVDMSSPEGQDIPRDQRSHHTQQQEDVLKSLGDSAQKNPGSGWGGWGSWGSSLLSAASTSVQTFTSQVEGGLTTLMDTVESTLGVPDPNELVKPEDVKEPEDGPGEKCEDIKKSEKAQSSVTEEGDGSKGRPDETKEAEVKPSNSWFSSWGVADLAKKVSVTGKSLASKGQTLMAEGFDAVENLAAGGIDVLETIGKKTYNTLSEHDPSFKKTREFLNPKGDKPNLSSVLREAKDQAEVQAEQEKEYEEARKAHFGTLFDDYQGIAHLEALEILSNQSEKKVHSLLNSLGTSDLTTIKPMLIAIKEAFELPEEEEESSDKEEDFPSLVSQCLSELELGTAPDKLNKVHEMVKQWMLDFDAHESHEEENVKSIHQRSIQALAELTSKGVEQFHKAGELVLMDRDTDKDCTERAHSLARLTGVLCHEVGNLATKFAGCLNTLAEQQGNGDDGTALVTNIYLEASNSSTYIQDAFQLLLPVLQQAALEHSINSRT